MYQALVRITKDDRTATDTPPKGSRFDWAVLLDALLRRMRETRDRTGQDSGDGRRQMSRSGG